MNARDQFDPAHDPNQPLSMPIYTVDNYPQEASVAGLMNIAMARYTDALDVELAEYGITAAQWGLLKAVLDGRANTPTSLCKVRYLYSGVMTHILDRLEDKGLLARRRSAQDRRVVEVVLTEAGENLVRTCLPIVVRMQNCQLSGFTHEENGQLLAFLARMNRNIETFIPGG